MPHYPRLKDLREDNDFTQARIAELLLITQQQYSLYERGYRDIPTSALITLADFYNTTIDTFSAEPITRYQIINNVADLGIFIENIPF